MAAARGLPASLAAMRTRAPAPAVAALTSARASAGALPTPALCRGWRALHSSAPSAAAGASAPASATASAPPPDRVAAVFHDPRVAAALTPRQRQVFQTLADEPPTGLLGDHGFLYATPEAELAGRSEMVRRALSTRTGGTRDQLAFRKSELLRKYGRDEGDAGSSRVQVAMMTESINRMASHLAANHHDQHCKRQLALLSVRRRRLLEYMMRTDYQNYRLMTSDLGLRPQPVLHSRYLPKVRAETHAQVNERNRKLKNRTSKGHLGH